MITPDDYAEALDTEEHEPPIPVELMEGLYRNYERRKERIGALDFEDMLGLAIRMIDDYPVVAERIRDRYLAFTVDEFQDVNPLQAALLDRWLGGREELCVVGDDYQTIFGFTGASPSYLLTFPERYPNARIVRLEENYRSTPEILVLANRLAPLLGGFDKELRATRATGPEPLARSFPSETEEVAWVVDRCRTVHEQGVAWEEIAILMRINARTEPYEEAFAGAGIPYQVRTGAFLQRPAARSVLGRLRRQPEAPVQDAIERATDALGFDAAVTPDSEEERTRQSDLGRFRSLAEEFAEAHGDEATVGAFVAELPKRFSVEESGRGVQLLTYHRSKGLEFDVVFLPRVLDGEVPYRSGRTAADPQEERRLFYVGLTRARHWLAITWPTDGKAGASPFVAEATGRVPEAVKPAAKKQAVPSGDPLFERLRAWRRDRAAADGVPPYVVFHDKTLVLIAETRPTSSAALRSISGVGPAKVDRYADDLLAVITSG